MEQHEKYQKILRYLEQTEAPKEVITWMREIEFDYERMQNWADRMIGVLNQIEHK